MLRGRPYISRLPFEGERGVGKNHEQSCKAGERGLYLPPGI